MRHLERSILLQVIDNRWREHLFDMDYLREGIHLRGFAQIDPLVAYKNEGFNMFSELMHSIWDEFSKLSSAPKSKSKARKTAPPTAPTRRPRSTTPAAPPPAQPSALEQVAIAGGGAARRRRWRASQSVGGDMVETVVKDEHDKVGRNDPCWCGSGKKYKKCHGA